LSVIAAYVGCRPLLSFPTRRSSDLFAVRADTPLGTVASLLSLGGIWNARAVPPGFAEPVGAVGRLVLSLVALTGWGWLLRRGPQDRKSTRLNSSHVKISYAVFCLKK